MHGQIGERGYRAEFCHAPGLHDRSRAAAFDTCRRMSDGTIDYDFYRGQAHILRNGAKRDVLMRLIRLVRPLLGIAAIVAAIWIMPTRSENCSVCDLHRIVSGNAASVILPDYAPMRP